MYYLAYGSNLSVEQMAHRCPGALPVGTVQLPDTRLVFRGSHSGFYLSIDSVEGCTTPCVVWRISRENELSLDRYEGYPNFYDKIYYHGLSMKPLLFHQDLAGKVFYHGDTKRRTLNTAMAYALLESAPMGMPTPYYWRVCRDGYRYFGFDEKPLLDALRQSKEAADSKRGTDVI